MHQVKLLIQKQNYDFFFLLLMCVYFLNKLYYYLKDNCFIIIEFINEGNNYSINLKKYIV